MRLLSLVRLCALCGLMIVALSVACAAPTPADTTFATANQFFKIGNDQQAAQEFQRFLTDYPRDTRGPQAAFMLGYSLQQLQKPAKALKAYTAVINKTGSDAAAELRANTHYQMAECYRTLKDDEKAAAEYAYFLALNSQLAPARKDSATVTEWQAMAVNAHYWRAMCLSRLSRAQDDEAAAVQEYASVLTLAPQDPLAPWASLGIGIIELNRTHYTAAITAFQRVSQDYSTSEIAGEATVMLGLAYTGRAEQATESPAKHADEQQAITILSTALNLDHVTDASKQQAALALAGAYYAEKDYPHAASAFTRAITFMDPASREAVDTRMRLAHTLYTAQQYADASKEYARIAANKTEPSLAHEAWFWYANCRYQLATMKQNVQDFADAAAAAERFLTPPGDRDERAAQACLLQAVCYEELTNRGQALREKATATYTRILQQWPASSEAAQARTGIMRLAHALTPLQLKVLSGNLPSGAVMWDVGLQLAYKEYQDGHYAATLTAARQVLDGKPQGETLAQTAYLLGASQQKLGHAKEAQSYFQQVVAATPNGVLAPYAQQALVLLQLDARNYPDAVTAAQALVKAPTLAKDDAGIAEERSERLMYLAAAYQGNQQLLEAEATYRKVTADYPHATQAPMARLNVARLADMRKDTLAAIAGYQDFLVQYPDDELAPDAFYQLGVLYSAQKDDQKAISAFQNVPESSPLADQAAYGIAWAYWDQQQFTQANAQFARITEKFPKSPFAAESWYHLGQAQMQRKEYLSAMGAFSNGLDLLEMNGHDALVPLLAFQLGTCAYQVEQYALAANAFGKVVANYPTNQYADESLFWKAMSLEQQGPAQAASAREAYLLYLTTYPTQAYAADAAVGAGRMALASGQYATARADLQKAASVCASVEQSKDPKLSERAKSLEAEVQFTIAQSYFAEKNYTRALKEFAAVSIYKYDPWYSRAYLQMARCSALLGDKTNAASTLQLLQRIAPDSDAAKQVKDVAKELGLQM
jgi:TolA-binding protein